LAGMERAKKAVKLLADKDYLISNMPYITGLEGDKVRLTFKRFIFTFTDLYRINPTHDPQTPKTIVDLVGEKSSIHLEFWPQGEKVGYSFKYRGPRGFLIKKLVKDMAAKLAEKAYKDAEKAVAEEARVMAADYSEKLASLAWTSKLIQKSILVDQRLLALPPGGLLAQIEGILAEKDLLSQYPLVYVSGTGDVGTFKLLFGEGRLLGVYANIGGEEYYGDEKVLNRFEGLVTLRIYATVGKLEEVVAQ